MRRIYIFFTIVLFFSCLSFAVSAQENSCSPQDMPFYVYRDTGSSDNHFYPSGWMGDWGEVKYNDDSRTGVYDGQSCIRITYFAKGFHGAGWAGMYWQNPLKNWGTVAGGGFNLTKAKKLIFYARGEYGGEVISEFKIGGISGNYPDSGTASIGPIVLTDQWQEYAIDLSLMDLSYISGGFCWSTSKDANAGRPITFYLDGIKYE